MHFATPFQAYAGASRLARVEGAVQGGARRPRARMRTQEQPVTMGLKDAVRVGAVRERTVQRGAVDSLRR